MPERTPHRLAAFQRLVAGMCAFVVFALGALAASPQLHEDVHADCCEPEHVCAITLFSHAPGEIPATILQVEPAVFRVERQMAIDAPVWRSAQLRLFPPSCGPPRAA
jgi:hypothetical protein